MENKNRYSEIKKMDKIIMDAKDKQKVFDLSNWIEDSNWADTCIPTDRVKEFIKLLKEEIHKLHGISTETHHNIWIILDKLSGEKLI